jgi:hypothetical protein
MARYLPQPNQEFLRTRHARFINLILEAPLNKYLHKAVAGHLLSEFA